MKYCIAVFFRSDRVDHPYRALFKSHQSDMDEPIDAKSLDILLDYFEVDLKSSYGSVDFYNNVQVPLECRPILLIYRKDDCYTAEYTENNTIQVKTSASLTDLFYTVRMYVVEAVNQA